MEEGLNPYQSTSTIAGPVVPLDGEVLRPDWFAIAAWPCLFMLNMVFPLLMGWMMTSQKGRIGLGAASLIWLILGWLLCYYKPDYARRLLIGSVLTACSQVFPVLHIILGFIGIFVAEIVGGRITDTDMGPGLFANEIGAFIVTFVVGGGLIIMAGGIGAFIGLFMPKRDPARYTRT